VTIVVLDSGPLGIVTNPKATPTNEACRSWLRGLLSGGARVVLPEIADYEVRRELLRENKVHGVARLDALKSARGFVYQPLTTGTMLRAAALWASARRQGTPTADPKALDGDVILAAQAEAAGEDDPDVVVATTNAGHLRHFVRAERWEAIVLP
jgi:hypothetical protein